MKLAIISNAPIVVKNSNNYLYAPYLNEVRLWGKNVDIIEFCCPIWKDNQTLLVDKISSTDFKYNVNQTHDFNIKSFTEISKTVLYLPINFFKVIQVMKAADHIHLRCPGNLGLLGCIAQIFFPNKKKTAKYAGNWDPKSKQPLSYKIQKWILNNTFLTKNMQVLVYGEWKGATKNIKPFFTATYTNVDAQNAVALPPKYITTNTEDNIVFMFVGTLNPGKRPLFALQVFHEIIKNKPNCVLFYFGDGPMREELETYIHQHKLSNKVILKGNKNSAEVASAYQKAHFLFLASQSEGWPKVVAEAMFWGCVPLATNISCVHQMMGYGERGELLHLDIQNDAQKILSIINDSSKYTQMSEQGKKWATNYTIDRFEQEIIKLL